MKPEQAVKNWYSDINNWKHPGFDKNDPDREFLPDYILRNKHVLNLGCFYPRIEIELSHTAQSWTSIDFSESVIERCKTYKTNANFMVMDMQKLAFESESFDTVLDLSSGDHMLLEDYIKSLKEAYRVLRPYGYFVVTYANRNFYPSEDRRVDVYGLHGYERRTTNQELKQILLDTKFNIILENSRSIRSGFLCQK